MPPGNFKDNNESLLKFESMLFPTNTPPRNRPNSNFPLANQESSDTLKNLSPIKGDPRYSGGASHSDKRITNANPGGFRMERITSVDFLLQDKVSKRAINVERLPLDTYSHPSMRKPIAYTPISIDGSNRNLADIVEVAQDCSPVKSQEQLDRHFDIRLQRGADFNDGPVARGQPQYFGQDMYAKDRKIPAKGKNASPANGTPSKRSLVEIDPIGGRNASRGNTPNKKQPVKPDGYRKSGTTVDPGSKFQQKPARNTSSQLKPSYGRISGAVQLKKKEEKKVNYAPILPENKMKIFGSHWGSVDSPVPRPAHNGPSGNSIYSGAPIFVDDVQPKATNGVKPAPNNLAQARESALSNSNFYWEQQSTLATDKNPIPIHSDTMNSKLLVKKLDNFVTIQKETRSKSSSLKEDNQFVVYF